MIDRPGSVQTSLALGTLSVERTSADYFPLLVMNQVYGAGPASRLFRNLREDKGYTYGAYSGFTTSKYPGVLIASAQVRTEVTEGALKEFMYEINRIRNERLAADELENAKRALTGSFPSRSNNPQLSYKTSSRRRFTDYRRITGIRTRNALPPSQPRMCNASRGNTSTRQTYR